MANGKPRPLFYLVMLAVVGGLIYVGVNRFSNRGAAGDTTTMSSDELAQVKGGIEAPDDASLTTVKEYTFVPGTKLPEVKGSSAYALLVDNTVRMALNVWAGWAPVIVANNGFKPGKVWKSGDGTEFKVELVLIDNPIEMRDAYAAGDVG